MRTKYVTVSTSEFTFFLTFYDRDRDIVDTRFIVSSIKPTEKNMLLFLDKPFVDIPISIEDVKKVKTFYQMTEKEFMKKGIMTNYEKIS